MIIDTYRRVQRDTYTLTKDELHQALADFLLKEAGVEVPSLAQMNVDAVSINNEIRLISRLNNVDEVSVTVDWT